MQQPEWKGAQPQRFSGGRIHLCPENQLTSTLVPNVSNIGACGIRTFNRNATQEAMFKPHLKIFPQTYHKSTNEIDLRGKKYVSEWPQKPRNRSERTHLPGNFETIDEVKLRGIKSYKEANSTRDDEYRLEGKMQKKIRVNGLEGQRNKIATASLGDKAYKYPEYSDAFFKAGGLIAGSTIRPRGVANPFEQKIGSVLTKPNWDVKVKLDQIEEDKKVVNDVDEWEQTILKEANPNWNDPDTFFERMQAQQSKKDQKKGAKK